MWPMGLLFKSTFYYTLGFAQFLLMLGNVSQLSDVRHKPLLNLTLLRRNWGRGSLGGGVDMQI